MLKLNIGQDKMIGNNARLLHDYTNKYKMRGCFFNFSFIHHVRGKNVGD